MRFDGPHTRIAILACLMMSVGACQSAHKRVAVVPPSAPPALKPAPQPQASGSLNQTAAAQDSQSPNEAPAQAVQADQASASTPAPDAIDDLIAKVEKEYQAGLANYKAGAADDAKQHFDQAFNTLLDSELDIRSDGRLQREFDHIVDGVNQLSLGDEAPGNQTADSDQQQKSEPAPIDETNGMTPAADASTKAKVEAEIKSTHSDLPLMMTDQVAGYISYFSGRGRGSV